MKELLFTFALVECISDLLYVGAFICGVIATGLTIWIILDYKKGAWK